MNPSSEPAEFEIARLRQNLLGVTARIAAAAVGAGRSPAEVRVVGVTKSVSAGRAGLLAAAGLSDLGENRPEDLAAKRRALGAVPVRWHLIGHLQSRKIREVLPAVHLFHALHSTSLGAALSRRAGEYGLVIPCLVQVNVSGEPSKQGFAPDEVAPGLDVLRALPGLELRGLMTMAPLEGGREAARRIFAATRELRNRVAGRGMALPELSMGMSGDFEEAVAEGATTVRIGSLLFEGLPESPAAAR